MIAGNPEAIALVINTEARMQGVIQARAGLNELGGTIDKMSPRIRTAANAATTLAFGLQGAGGSAQSMAIAAGTLTTSLATLATSAKIAASATGIGALVVVMATVTGWFRTAGAEAKKAGEEFSKALKGMVDAVDVGKLSKAAAVEFAAVQLSEGRIARMKAELEAFKGSQADAASLGLRSAAMERAIEKEEALTVKLRARYHATLAGVDIATAEAISNTASAISVDKWTAAQAAAATAAERSLEARRKLLEATEKELAVDRAAAGSRVGTQATEQAGRILSPMGTPTFPAEQIDIMGRAVDNARSKWEGLTLAVQEAIMTMKEGMPETITSIIRGGAGAVQALKRLALEPIISKLEGIAIKEAVEALEWAAALNFPMAAKHAAVAAAATAAATKVAQLAGTSSSSHGGRGGYGGGTGENVGTFRPSYGGGSAGGQTVNIIVRDANDRDSIAETIYNTSRARSLNVSGLPPTRGVDVRVA